MTYVTMLEEVLVLRSENAELRKQLENAQKALYRIAHHSETMSDFPHGVQGLQMIAFDALVALTDDLHGEQK